MYNHTCLAVVFLCPDYQASGAVKLKQDFSFTSFVPDDSPLIDILDIDEFFFQDIGMPFFVVTPAAEYHKEAVSAYLIHGASDLLLLTIFRTH